MSNSKWNRILCTGIALTVILTLLVGCGPAATPTAKPRLKFTLIVPMPIGDRSYIDAGYEGFKRAEAELEVDATLIEATGVPEHEPAIRGAANQGFDLIVTMSMDPDMLLSVAEEFPNVLFGAVDTFYPDDVELPSNLAAWLTEPHEASFLVGIAAGMLTRTGIVGAVGGLDIAGINTFIVAYEEGVHAVNPEAQTLRGYAGSFVDPTIGKELAMAQYEQGADIIYQVAGLTGEGVIAAAKETGNFAIGVDSNQDWIAAGNVIVSMVKRVDNLVYDFVQAAIGGTFESGYKTVGVPDGGTGLSWDMGSDYFEKNGPQDMVSKLPDVKAKVDEYRKKILSGEYTVRNLLLEE
ncbi:MAG: BMP family ABC transporter substrate-binding protein [Anaerolineales bacterium]|nr:MAG: BMP family ABC transporter substrate-binding protein [Anaerolineales bacterium]